MSLTWITPKTNWSAGTGATPYDGDYFNAVDYNRIRNNLLVLTDLAEQLYSDLEFTSSIGAEKTYSSWLYPDEINAIELRLKDINVQTLHLSLGTTKTFYNNARGLDAAELNRIESGCLALYNPLKNQAGGRRMLRFTLGIPASAVRG